MKVRAVTASELTRVKNPTRGPGRSRTRSNVARWLIAAIRPDISAKTQIPTTPTTTTHAKDIPNRAPTTALVTRSPMSTKPPIAVRMPRATASSRFIAATSQACLPPIERPLQPGQLGEQRRQVELAGNHVLTGLLNGVRRAADQGQHPVRTVAETGWRLERGQALLSGRRSFFRVGHHGDAVRRGQSPRIELHEGQPRGRDI